MKELLEVQEKLKAPKNQFNNFGNYNYRSCEDILEGVKPLLKEYNLQLTISDKIVLVGNRVYVEATVKLTNGSDSVEVTAYAREAENKKGMDDAQITGSASSYARKYALNGLFLIDDTKDVDSHDNSNMGKPATKKSSGKQIDFDEIKENLSGLTEDGMVQYWKELDSAGFTSDKQREAVLSIFKSFKGGSK